MKEHEGKRKERRQGERKTGPYHTKNCDLLMYCAEERLISPNRSSKSRRMLPARLERLGEVKEEKVTIRFSFLQSHWYHDSCYCPSSAKEGAHMVEVRE